MTLKSDDGLTWTFIRQHDRSGLLLELLRELPSDRPLYSAQVHTARDGSLVLDMFSYAQPDLASESAAAAKASQLMDLGSSSVSEVKRTLMQMTERMVGNVSARRLARIVHLVHQVEGTDDVAVDAGRTSDGRSLSISIAAGQANPRKLFERVAAVLVLHGAMVRRAYLDPIPGLPVALCTLVIDDPGQVFAEHESAFADLVRDVQRVRWLDERVLLCAHRTELPLPCAEALVALLDLAHTRLSRRGVYAFSRERMGLLAARHLALARRLADDLLLHTQLGREALRRSAVDGDAREVLNAVADAVAATRASNLSQARRRALVLSVDPQWLLSPEHVAVPHSVLFSHGLGYRAFHVRFRPIARGGLRVVIPRAADQHTVESERLFDEVYGLSYAQQLKNKDIPEGGAKGVLLIEPGADPGVAVRAFVDSVLDLALATGDLFYLGPDENITPALIEWIASRAAARGYAQASAFMSSKPGAGINHKVYGVTSEGVVIFLDAALRAIGIDPHQQPFTVKVTGGPDGDVAGNLFKILWREYGHHARIVGVADGSGCGEDPEGLDMGELLRLVDEERPIADYDRTRLSGSGRIVRLDDPNGVRLRNTLHERVAADAFVPAGGRPRTLHSGNWRAFLHGEVPSAKVIVEGANLFLSPDARRHLEQAGVLVFKDSSANKCGVICSSFEIVACMLLDEATFMGVKEPYVAQVLDALRLAARREAHILLGLRGRGHTLPELSVKLSAVMNRAADAVVNAWPTLPAETQALLHRLIQATLPPVLVEQLDADPAALLPSAYVQQLVGTAAASRVVYHEGIDDLEHLDEATLARHIITWLQADLRVQQLAGELASAGYDEAASLLKQGGARTLLRRPLLD